MIFKNLILLLFMTISVNACAMGGKPYRVPERKAQDKMFRPCQNFETENPLGKLCNRTCAKRKGKKCKQWKTTVKDFSDPEVFKWFRAGSFIMIDEDQVL